MPRWQSRVGAGLVFLAILFPAQSHSSDAPAGSLRRVLILHSFGQHFEPFQTVASAFRTELTLGYSDPIEFFEVSIETDRLAEGDIDQALADYVRARCASRPVDLVVPIGNPALQFWQVHRDHVFPRAPVLVAGIEARHLQGVGLDPNTTAVTFSLDLVGFIEDILHILPHTTNLSVVIGDSPLEKYWTGEMRRAWQVFNDRVAFTWLNDLSLAGMRDRMAAMPPNSAIVFVLVDIDAAGVPYEQGATLDTLSKAATAPIFGFFEPQLGHGLVGGRMTDLRGLGKASAQLAHRILAGESPGSIPPLATPLLPPIFDWRELKRWDIHESQLPSGSEVRFRQPTLWQLYKWRVVAAGALILLEGLLIFILLKNRKRLRTTRAELVRNEEDIRLAARAAKLGFWTLDFEKDRLWITDEGRALFGWDPTEPLGFERFLATLRPEDREPTRRGMRRALDQGGEFETEYQIILGDGSARWVVTRGRAEKNGGQERVRLHGVTMDVTARRQAIDEARGLRRELSHTARVSLLGQFTTSLAHEMGQPLGAILRNTDAAELLLKRSPLDLEEIQGILVDVRNDCERAGLVIERLRGLLRRSNIEMQRLVWSEVVHEAASIVRSDARARGIVLEIEMPLGLPPVRGDRVHLEQVLINLMANAMDAMDGAIGDERRITVSARALDEANIECAVSDTGPGIAPNRLTGIFDPFVTTKPNGMGMGLPICQSIVETLGGRLWAENNPGRGATFRFTIPSAEAP